MPMTGIRELSRRLSHFIEQVEETGRPLVVTRHGHAVAAIVRVDAAELEEFILAHAPDFDESLSEAEDALARGETHSLQEVLAAIQEDDERAEAEASRHRAPSSS